jgi:hypothetical protein
MTRPEVLPGVAKPFQSMAKRSPLVGARQSTNVSQGRDVKKFEDYKLVGCFRVLSVQRGDEESRAVRLKAEARSRHLLTSRKGYHRLEEPKDHIKRDSGRK